MRGRELFCEFRVYWLHLAGRGRRSRCAGLSSVVVVVGLLVNDVHAEPHTARRVQLALAVDYGLYTGESGEVIPSPYGLGLGLKVGHTLDPGVYLGAESNYFFGASRRFPQYGDVEGSLRIFHYGVEGGYDIELTPAVVLRPKLGVGGATVMARVRVEGNEGEVSESGPVFALGGQLIVGWERAFVSGEVRYTSFSVGTGALAEIPGAEVDERARLDGLLFAACLGVAF